MSDNNVRKVAINTTINGQEMDILVDPYVSLLETLREVVGMTGTKEGCNDGNCGACSVLINNRLVNACLMLGIEIEGKDVVTVEGLADVHELHPVQEAFVLEDGLQCGYCTPGFIVATKALLDKNANPTEDEIRFWLAGNLCRCTGYRPIVEAAKSLNKDGKRDFFAKDKKKTLGLLKKIKNRSIKIINDNKKYFAPKFTNELNKILRSEPNSKLISGGTDVSLIVTKERKDLNSLIYLNSIDELNYIKENNGFIEVGASTPLIKFESFIKKYFPDFSEVLKRYGSVQIRNVCTIAGNIATASPIGDTLPLLLALDSQIIVKGKNKTQILPINGFFTNYRKTKLKKGQFIHSIRIPFLKQNIFKAYKISKRIDDDISSVCASFNIEINKDKIKKIRIAYGGMSSTPKRAFNCEKVLVNSNISYKTIGKAKKLLEKDFKPITDTRATQNYRMEVAKNLLEKCFSEVKQKKNIRING